MVIRSELGLACAAAILCLVGCNGPQQRFFAWCQRDLRTEARTYEFHDPYPDEVAGPDTDTRPRTFQEPRSDTRKDFDLRLLLSMSGGSNGPILSRRPFNGARSYNGALVSPISPAVPMQPYAAGPYPAPSQPGPIATQPTYQLQPVE